MTREQDIVLEGMANHYGGIHVRPMRNGTRAVIATPSDDDRYEKAVYIPADALTSTGTMGNPARPATRDEYNAAVSVTDSHSVI
jgi:hypothetical protein